MNPLIVALDTSDEAQALKWVAELSGLDVGFKVGSELFTTAGPPLIRQIRKSGARVFLDLKYHDIPNTVAKAVAAATRLDVQMLTLHISGGSEMLIAAKKSAEDSAASAGHATPLLLGVTVLTSTDSNELAEVGVEANVGKQVDRLASVAVKAGLNGLVCSPLEIAALRQSLPRGVQLVTPGIREAGDKSDDQKRTLTAAQAMAAGANWIVVGRPICAAPQPRAAAEKILQSLRGS